MLHPFYVSKAKQPNVAIKVCTGAKVQLYLLLSGKPTEAFLLVLLMASLLILQMYNFVLLFYFQPSGSR